MQKKILKIFIGLTDEKGWVCIPKVNQPTYT